MRVRLLGRILLITFAGLAASGLGAGVAHADSLNPVDCEQNPRAPHCKVTVTLPGKHGGSGGSGTARCRYPDGKPAPCRNGHGGYLGSDGCYYEPSEHTNRGPHGEAPPTSGPGRWYFRSGHARWCDNGVGWWVWVPDGSGITPEQLAQQAVDRLRLPAFTVRLNPSPPARQLVHLPMWIWVDRSVWTARSATASVPGLSVTATARPTRMVVSTGDGVTVTCRGPGAPWRSGKEPHAASPTCGHTYTRPGSRRVTATVTWSVGWAGGGASGTVPALTTTSTRAVRVTESQALNGR